MRVFIFAPVFLLLAGCRTFPETDEIRIAHSGDLATLEHGSRTEVPLALSKGDAHVLAQAVDSGDDSGVKALIDTGKATFVPAHSRVRVTGESYNERRVQVIEGLHAGKVGWVPFEWLRFTRQS